MESLNDDILKSLFCCITTVLPTDENRSCDYRRVGLDLVEKSNSYAMEPRLIIEYALI